MATLIFYAVLVWTSFVFAKVEIAIEGKNGWAAALPTWRLPMDSRLNKIFFSGKQLTGYHFWVNIFTFTMLHLVYLYAPFSWTIELKILAFLVLFWIVEDFLWFVLNPAYGIRKFTKENVTWHAATWFFIAPREYFLFGILGILLYILSLRVLI